MPGRRNGLTRCGRSWASPRASDRGRERRLMPSKDPQTSAAAREGQTLLGRGLLLRHANLVRLPHTVFALPFALVGAVLASYVAPITLSDVIWVVVAFTTARFAAMGFN